MCCVAVCSLSEVSTIVGRSGVTIWGREVIVVFFFYDRGSGLGVEGGKKKEERCS